MVEQPESEIAPDSRATRAATLGLQTQLDVLRGIHTGLVSTRRDLTAVLGLARGFASEITRRLRDADLVGEEPDSSRRRGRPTTRLIAHPRGPLVAAVDVSHERWQAAIVELGGDSVARLAGRHRERSPEPLLADVGARLRSLVAPVAGRVRVAAISVPGTVMGTRVVQASNLGWRDIDVAAALRPMVPRHTNVVVGNDATFGGLAEARRGAGTDAAVVLHLMVEVGVGGVLVIHRRPMTGATGAGGEIGHLPFGDPGRRCSCGANGCWDMEVDGRALARHLGRPAPRNPRAAADRAVAAAGAGDDAARRAVATVAAALGRGIGGLVNALDPDAITVSGLATDLLDLAQADFERAYRRALMAYRRSAPPPVRCATVAEGSLVGAAEAAFDVVLAEPGLTDWILTRSRPARS